MTFMREFSMVDLSFGYLFGIVFFRSILLRITLGLKNIPRKHQLAEIGVWPC